MFSATCLLLALAVPQNPWVVDLHARPGTNFVDLPPAVAAAANGDTILVRGLQNIFLYYSAFTVSGKVLTIRGEDPALSRCSGATIRAVPQGSVFALQGMGLGFVNIDASNVAIVSSSLSVSIDHGSHVELAGCRCGGDFPALVTNNSTLVALGSVFTGADYRGSPPCMSRFGSSAIDAADSRVILHNCWASGGWSMSYMPAGPFGGCLPGLAFHSPGISLLRSTLRLAGAATQITGSVEISADAASTGTIHGDVPPLSAGPQFVRVPAVLPELSVSGPWNPIGTIPTTSPVVVSLAAPVPGAPVVMAFATTPPVAADLTPLALGDVMLPVSTYFLATTLDGAGQFTVTLPGYLVPWIGIPVFGQAAVLDAAAGQFLMSNLGVMLFTR